MPCQAGPDYPSYDPRVDSLTRMLCHAMQQIDKNNVPIHNPELTNWWRATKQRILNKLSAEERKFLDDLLS